MVAGKDPRNGVGPIARPAAPGLFWAVLLTIGIVSGLGVLVTTWQRAELRQRFALFSEHAMEAAFHLHDLSLRIATLATDRLEGQDAAERERSLASYRVTIAAHYADVSALKIAYFESVLSGERRRTLEAIQAGLAALHVSVPVLLDALREATRSPELSLDGARLREPVVAAMSDARDLNNALRYAEALAFIGLKNALERSNATSLATIVTFALISGGSISVLGWAWRAARSRESALREAKESAERLLEREREFVANTSHELRTPVSGILGTARLLAREALSGEAARLSRHVLDAAEDLSDLVGTVLDSQTEGAEPGEASEWLRPSLCLADTIGRFRQRAEAQGLSFRVLDELVGMELLCQRRTLMGIVSALLSNAVKFTERGSIRIELSLWGETPRIAIADTGIGMDQATLAHATERFFQAEASHTKRHRGLGLGLWNAQRGVVALGGSLEIRSEVGRGTEVVALIPAPSRRTAPPQRSAPGREPEPTSQSAAPERDSGAQAAGAVTGEPEPGSDSTPPSAPAARAILVAEDDAINRMTLQFLLGKAGYQVIAAADGAAALELASKERFGLALLDISMPYYTGIDVLSSIRERERTRSAPRIPAIALTGHSTAEDRRACMAAGFDEFITKPYSEGFLLERISQALATQDA